MIAVLLGFDSVIGNASVFAALPSSAITSPTFTTAPSSLRMVPAAGCAGNTMSAGSMPAGSEPMPTLRRNAWSGSTFVSPFTVTWMDCGPMERLGKPTVPLAAT